jgi:hypothetical protein
LNREKVQISSEFPGYGTGLVPQVPEAVLHLKSALDSGATWYQALLEAVGLWTLPQEVYQGRNYQYLIRGEAFDWLLLAERLCAELDGVIPVEDKEALLLNGQLPEAVTPEVFRELIGVTKHGAYLNYWYGVVLEEALQLAVEQEVRKRHRARCYPDSEELVEQAFAHLYGKNRSDLLAEFLKSPRSAPPPIFETVDPEESALSLTELKEFTYWLFKHRVNVWDPARVASDTRKGLRQLTLLEQREYSFSPDVLDFSRR